MCRLSAWSGLLGLGRLLSLRVGPASGRLVSPGVLSQVPIRTQRAVFFFSFLLSWLLPPTAAPSLPPPIPPFVSHLPSPLGWIFPEVSLPGGEHPWCRPPEPGQSAPHGAARGAIPGPRTEAARWPFSGFAVGVFSSFDRVDAGRSGKGRGSVDLVARGEGEGFMLIFWIWEGACWSDGCFLLVQGKVFGCSGW